MKEGQLRPELRRLLDIYDRAGGAVQYACFSLEPGETADEDLMRRAAVLGLQCMMRATAARAPEWAARWDITAAIDHERASRIRGRRIAADEFLGPCWFPERRTLIIRASKFDSEMRGFAYAFSDPPHGIGLDRVTLNTLFITLCDWMFPSGLESPDAQIWEWPSDWSRYFEDGHEWWGAFVWTVCGGDRRVHVLAASATD